MKLFKSIKWRLQLWYGLILVAVLMGFGITAYQLEKGRQMGRIDQKLHRRFAALTDVLHQFRQRGRGRPPFGGPPPGQMPDDFRLQGDLPPPQFSLPPTVAGLFGTNQPDDFYFVIESRDGKEIARAGNVPSHVVLSRDNSMMRANKVRDLKGAKPPPAWTENGYREICQFSPPNERGDMVLVGCSLKPELKELHQTAFNLTVAGSLILLVGLTGGWWLVSRALKPISGISATATKISAGDLSQRINVAEAESELGQLATVLNSTFARLETAFAQQKQFASDAAHELRTPVSVILTQTQTALNRERDAASYRQTVEACQRAAQRMRKLIESLLELARFDAGQEVLKRLPFDFSKAVLDSADMVQTLADERRVKLFVEAGPLEVAGDPERLGQVVTNLLTNAIQYNQPQGEVRVKLEPHNRLAVLTVADTGQGIAAEDLAHVFDRFYRADQSRTGAGSAGLGLAICKAIIEAHGGTIEASSEANAGTIFTVRLPV